MFTKENTGSFIVLIVFISLMVISYERVKNVVVEIVDTEKGVETRTRKSIVVNGKK
jgi:hypothetical protein